MHQAAGSGLETGATAGHSDRRTLGAEAAAHAQGDLGFSSGGFLDSEVSD